MGASPGWTRGVGPAPRRARPGAGGRARGRQLGPTAAASGPNGGPPDCPAGAALEKAPATPLRHALQQRLRPYQVAAGRDACASGPDDGPPLTAPGRWLALM